MIQAGDLIYDSTTGTLIVYLDSVHDGKTWKLFDCKLQEFFSLPSWFITEELCRNNDQGYKRIT